LPSSYIEPEQDKKKRLKWAEYNSIKKLLNKKTNGLINQYTLEGLRLLFKDRFDIDEIEKLLIEKERIYNEIVEIGKSDKKSSVNDYIMEDGGIVSENITFNDFHLATFANYIKIKSKEVPQVEPNFISRSGSKYWYVEDYVVRQSDHWGRTIASCNWLLNGCAYKGLSQGKCKLSDFERTNFGKLIAGNKYKVRKTSLRRNGGGCMDIEVKEGVFLKETSDFYIFDTFRVGQQSLASVKLLETMENGGIVDFNDNIQEIKDKIIMRGQFGENNIQ